jgi:hypothetical protein
MTPLQKDEVLSVFRVDIKNGRIYWKRPSKFHNELIGAEAGTNHLHHTGRFYRVIRYKRRQYKRAYLVFLVANGYWPKLIDHIDGDSLNDRPDNIREATIQQNNWNHRPHKKKSPLPPGIRSSPSGNFQARIRCDGVTTYKTFPTLSEAQEFYTGLREKLFGEYCG